MSKKECYFSGVVGIMNDKNGIFWLYDNAKVVNGGWLAVNGIEVLENLSRHQGLEALKEAIFKGKRGNEIMLFDVPLTIITKNTTPQDGNNKPLAAIEPSQDFLDKLDMIPNISKMLVVPFIVDEVDDWAIRNNAKGYSTTMTLDEQDKEDEKTNENNLDKVVIVALRELTSSINSHYTESEHPSIGYKIDSIKDALYLLRTNGYDAHPAIVRRFLIHKYNWKPVSAKMVEDIAESMRLGIFPFINTKRYDKPDVIDRWREEAKSL